MDRAALFRDVGGVAGCRALAEALYAGIADDPLLRPMFPGKKSLRCAIEQFSAFLVQYLDGPAEHYTEALVAESPGIPPRFRIGVRERDAWMHHMIAALDGFPEVREELRSFFEESSMYLVNEEAPVPTTGLFPLDDAVAAIRAGDPERAISLAANMRSRRPAWVCWP